MYDRIFACQLSDINIDRLSSMVLIHTCKCSKHIQQSYHLLEEAWSSLASHQINPGGDEAHIRSKLKFNRRVVSYRIQKPSIATVWQDTQKIDFRWDGSATHEIDKIKRPPKHKMKKICKSLFVII